MCGSGSSKVLNVSSTAESAVIQLHTDSTYSIFRGFSLSYRLQLQGMIVQLCYVAIHTIYTHAGSHCISHYDSKHNYDYSVHILPIRAERRSVSLCDAEDDNGGCEHTCIGDLQGQKTGCGCREGFQLTDDGLSCSGKYGRQTHIYVVCTAEVLHL